MRRRDFRESCRHFADRNDAVGWAMTIPPTAASLAPGLALRAVVECLALVVSRDTLSPGGVPERTNGAVLKTAGRRKAARGFESHPRR